MVRFMERRFVLASDCERTDLDTRLRLILHSCLEDGVYARELFDAVFERVLPFFTKSFEAAIAVGDVIPHPAATAKRVWFGDALPIGAVFMRANCSTRLLSGSSHSLRNHSRLPSPTAKAASNDFVKNGRT